MNLKNNTKKKQNEAVLKLIRNDIETYFQDSLEDVHKLQKFSSMEIIMFKQKLVNKWKSIDNVQNEFNSFLEQEQMYKYFIENFNDLTEYVIEYKKKFKNQEFDEEYIRKLRDFVLSIYDVDKIKYYKRAFLFFYLSKEYDSIS